MFPGAEGCKLKSEDGGAEGRRHLHTTWRSDAKAEAKVPRFSSFASARSDLGRDPRVMAHA